MARRASSPLGIFTSQSPLTRAPARFTDAPAGQNDGFARLEILVRAFQHRAGEIDAGNMRILPHQPPLPQQDQAVLVVQRRVADRDGDIAFGQLRLIDLLDRRLNLAVLLFQHQGFEHAALLQA
jgi:hypothetical protein